MYVPKRLWLRNFMSHKDSEFEFQNGKAVMIQGINTSDDGQLSNGSGKSAVLEGVSVALRGLPLRKVSSKDLVREGQKSLINQLTLTNNKNGTVLVIRRTIFSNTKSAELMITVDGEIPKELSVNSEDKIDVRQGNDWIISTIGISTEDLLNYFLISKEKHTSFLNMSDGPKKEVIGRFSKSNLLDPVYDIIQRRVDEIDKQIRQVENGIVANQGKIEVYVEEKDNADVEELKKRKQKKISDLSEQIEQFEALIRQKTTIKKASVKSLKEQRQLLNDNPEINNDDQIGVVSKKSVEFDSEIDELRKELVEIEDLKADVEKALKGTVECPECKTEFSISDDSFDIKASRESLTEFISAIQEVKQEISECRENQSQYDLKIKALKKQQVEREDVRRKLQSNIKDWEQNIKQLDASIDGLSQQIKDAEEQIQRVDQYVIQDRAAEYDEKIEELKVANQKLQTQKEGLDDSRFAQKEWSGVMTKFKTHLSNKAIAVIEAHCNEYLNRMKTNLNIQLEGYKVNRSGNVRENITAKVLRDGIETGLFDKFSSGEKARIEIAMIFSLQKLINMNTDSGGLDLCFLDEVIESVDSDGIDGIMNTLNDLGQTIVVVTHGTFNKNYPYITQVKKVDGISIIN